MSWNDDDAITNGPLRITNLVLPNPTQRNLNFTPVCAQLKTR
jgi:hypothetical protein